MGSKHVEVVRAYWDESERSDWAGAAGFPLLAIFKFDADDRIVLEEAYYDIAAVMRQLDYEVVASAT